MGKRHHKQKALFLPRAEHLERRGPFENTAEMKTLVSKIRIASIFTLFTAGV
jgi:hypothetical protein